MVAGVIAGLWRAGLVAAAHDAPGATVAYARCSDGVFAVVAAFVLGQQPFAIAKDRAVLLIRKGPALADQRIGLTTLGGQLRDRDALLAATGWQAARHARQGRERAGKNQHPCGECPARPPGTSLQHQSTPFRNYGFTRNFKPLV